MNLTQIGKVEVATCIAPVCNRSDHTCMTSDLFMLHSQPGIMSKAGASEVESSAGFPCETDTVSGHIFDGFQIFVRDVASVAQVDMVRKIHESIVLDLDLRRNHVEY